MHLLMQLKRWLQNSTKIEVTIPHTNQGAEVRKDFIDKLWIALGWDVNHDEQKNSYEQEVKVEQFKSIVGNRRAFKGYLKIII